MMTEAQWLAEQEKQARDDQAQMSTHICLMCAEDFIATGDIRCPACGSDECGDVVNMLVALDESRVA